MPLDEHSRSGSVWLEFTPSPPLAELLGAFIKPHIRDDVMAKIALRSENSASILVVPVGGGLAYKEDQTKIAKYKQDLESMEKHQFVLDGVSARKTPSKEVKFGFNAAVDPSDMSKMAGFEKFNFDRTKQTMGVYALLPFRYMTGDMHVQGLARNKIMEALTSKNAARRRGLYVTNPRWAERIDFEVIKGGVRNDNDAA